MCPSLSPEAPADIKDSPEANGLDTRRQSSSPQQPPSCGGGCGQGVLWPQIRTLLVADLSAVSVGINFGFSAVTLPQLRSDPDIQASEEDSSWIASCSVLSAPVGCLIGAVATDRFGRKKTLQMTAMPTLIGWILIASAQNLPTLYAGRVLTGITTGLSLGTLQVYLSEIAQVHLRGTLVSTSNLCLTCGTLMVYVLGSWVPWRWVAKVSAAVPVLFGAGMCFLPETPAWLVSRGRMEAARLSLRQLRGPRYEIKAELQVLAVTHRWLRVADKARPRATAKNHLRMLASKSALRPLAILTTLFLFQQFSGAFAVIFYAVDVFQSSADGIDSQWATVAMGVVRVLFTALTTLLTRRLGIRVLLPVSGVGMLCALLALGTYSYLDARERDHGLGTLPARWVPVLCIMLFMASFTVGFGTVPWMLVGELFPLRLRGVLASVMTSVGFCLIFMVVKLFPWLLHTLQPHGTYFLLACVAAAGTIFSWAAVPETRGKSLQEIEEIFGGRPNGSGVSPAPTVTTNQVAPSGANTPDLTPRTAPASATNRQNLTLNPNTLLRSQV